ncbi:insulin-like growth factor-binding protein 5 [Latimeria chalumnae]|uniref:Insulin-like growth factor-binding protein 1 n=1 Tax=Latimeria chalumnae TaxID=7897 RepID=M3XKQ0_LATCH|nr:PREDICTED: insulin-like growth factor-binding protein 5 [Latimeria chalumnae]|eukprot:XP_005991807.1 PREDICTED: insulin-like growth factor-binding protein 5 [Latimeria chalumnae]
MVFYFCLVLSLSLGLSHCLGSFVPCEHCDDKARSLCPPNPLGCELVKEPGCGCCLTCALAEGQSCGVYTEPCAQGMLCRPREGEEKPLHALLHGRGTCMREKIYMEQREKAMMARKSLENEDPTTAEITEVNLPLKPGRPKTSRGNVPVPERKRSMVEIARRKKYQSAKVMTSSENTARPRYPPDYKHESEQGPCRRQIENTLQEMKTSYHITTSRNIYLPNCDRKGFYKRKQCKPSKGRRRGICWCVDKYGSKLPGSGPFPGDIHCHHHSFDSSTIE